MLSPKQKLNLKSAWLISFACALSACGTIKIRDAEFCGDKGELGASCFHTLSEGARDLDKAAWDAERFGMICSTPETFADWKAAILKLCKVSKACTYEEKRLLAQFVQRMEAVKP